MGIFNDAPTPNYDDPATSGSPLGSLIASIVFGALATCAVAARLWARFGILHRAGVDDLLIVLALVGGQNNKCARIVTEFSKLTSL